MSSRKRRHLLIAGLGVVLLSSVWISCLDYLANRPDKAAARDRSLTGHTFPVQALAFSRDGATLTTAAFFVQHAPCEAEVAVWDVETRATTARHIQTLDNLFPLLALAPDSRSLIAVREQSLWRWDLDSPRGRQLCPHQADVSALALSSDGSRLAVADFANGVTLLDTASGRTLARCQGHVEPVFALAFAPDGTMLASGAKDGSIRLWDAATGKDRGKLQKGTQRGHADSVQTLAFGPDGKTLASGSYDGTIKLWDLVSQRERATLAITGDEATAIAFAPNGQTLAVTVGQVVQLWQVDPGRLMANLEGHQGKVKCLAFTPDSTRLASGGYDKTVRIWDVAGYMPGTP
jgi:WD40 repeat protein